MSGAYNQYRFLRARGRCRNRSGLIGAQGARPRLTLLLALALFLAAACEEPPRPEIRGLYRTRDGLAAFEFLPGGRYRFRHGFFELEFSGDYHLADARKVVLHLPLARADETGGPLILLRRRDELVRVRKDGRLVRFLRVRDAADGPAPLTGELPTTGAADEDAAEEGSAIDDAYNRDEDEEEYEDSLPPAIDE